MISDPYVIVTCDNCAGSTETHYRGDDQSDDETLRKAGGYIKGEGGLVFCCKECQKEHKKKNR